MTPASNRSPSVDALGVFRDPRSVTVVGASANPAKWGHWLAKGALAGGHRRAVHLVNRTRVDIEGRASFGGLDEIDGPLDLVVLCVPAVEIPGVVDAALERGARGFVSITAGLDSALGQPGAERELVGSIRAAGARIIGPNCLGIYDSSSDLQLAWGDFHPGPLAIVSQSGQVGSELTNIAAERGIGVSRFVSVGNQSDVGASEVLADLVHHDSSRVVVLYVESFVDGRAMVDTMRRLRAAGKPTVLLTVGASEASRQAARSHTGSLTSAQDVVDAACRAAGVVRVETPEQAINAVDLLVRAPMPAGRRIAIVGDSGGQGALAADVMVSRGLRVQPLGAETEAVVASRLPVDASRHNPIDLAGEGERRLDVYADLVEGLLEDDQVDALAVTGYFGSYGIHTPSLQDAETGVARRIAEAAVKHRKPVVLHSMCATSLTIDLLRDLGVPTYRAIEGAADSLATAVALMSVPGRSLAPAEPATATDEFGYLGSRRPIERAGIPFPQARRVTTRDEVSDAVSRMRGPYVLKADWLPHKSENEAVVVGLGDDDQATACFDSMVARLGTGEYVVEEMDVRHDCVEMLVGGRRDPIFGPTVMVGAGGVEAELFSDTAVELAPVDRDTATAMVQSLSSYRRLTGWRSRPSVDIDGLVDVVVTMSRLIAERPDCAEIEVNPLRVGPDGVLAVDALVVPDADPPT